MPKIFGEVVVGKQPGTATCKHCGYTWNPGQPVINSLLIKRKVTCPLCRLIKEHPVGIPLDAQSKISINTKVMSIPAEKISEQLYLDQKIPFQCGVCHNIFMVKGRDFNQFLESPFCPTCNPKKAKKLGITSQVDIARPTVKQPVIKPIKPQKQPEAKAVLETLEKTAPQPDSRAISQVEKLILANMGKVYNKSVIISSLNSEKQEFSIQCIHCGMERTLPLKVLTTPEQRSSEMKCIQCGKPRGKTAVSVSGLTSKYLGRVINGLKIIAIYIDKDGLTKCDVQCMDSTKQRIENAKLLEIPGHIIKELNFGDVINGHTYCETCGRKQLNLIPRIFEVIDCPNFKGMYKIGISGNNKVEDSISVSDIYTTEGSICEHCYRKDRCSVKNSLTHQFSFIRGLADSKDNQKAAVNDVLAKYPTIYNSMIKGASELKSDPVRGFVIFRDAYRSRDGQLYKFCKCCLHGTEMVLSESEIAGFDHEQCKGVKNPYMRFFELESHYMLDKPDKK